MSADVDCRLVSVIVPVYNTAPWLDACLDSVLNQTHAAVEVICLDDGSTDASPEILRRWAASDARVKVMSLSHAGVSVARNRGLEAATGAFVVFLDSDDMLIPEALEMMVRACETYGSDFAYTPTCQVAEDAKLADCLRPLSRMSEPLRSPTDFERIHGGGLGVNHALFRRSAIAGVRFDDGIAFGEDQLFWYRLFARGVCGCFLYDACMLYRQRAGSCCHTFGRDRKRASNAVIAQFLKTLLLGDLPYDFRVWAEDRLQGKHHQFDVAPVREDVRRCYAVCAARDVRSSSSSGGAFPVLASDVLERGGVVAGAAFAADWSVEHRLVETPADLRALLGSKYVRSRLTPSFWKSLETAVRSGRPVLFSGTPCQAVAVRRMFPKAPNLLILDFICHGAPDPAFWGRRVEELSQAGEIVSINFRDKRQGWGRPPYFCVRYADGSEYAVPTREDPYTAAYSANLMVSPCCANCAFPACRSAADITCGDFWELKHEIQNDGLGISCVVLNTENAARVWSRVRGRFFSVVGHPLTDVTQPNYRSATRPHPGSEDFRRAFDEGRAMSEVFARGADPTRNVAILNFHWENRNFGAVLTACALSRCIEEVGFRPRNIAFVPGRADRSDRAPAPALEDFRRRHIPETRVIERRKDLKVLRREYETFVVGSDQVWSPRLTKKDANAYFLTFAGPGRRLIAAAASTGEALFERFGARGLRRLLDVFDAVSVREASAAARLRKLSGRCDWMQDPVFWLEPSRWQELANAGQGRLADVVTYFVSSKDRAEIQNFLCKAQLDSQDGLVRSLTSADTPESWLDAIRHAELLVTQSFHGVAFALIFHTPFVCIVPREIHRPRLRSLLGDMGLADRLFDSAAEAAAAYAKLRPVEWSAVDLKLAEYRTAGGAFLTSALKSERFRTAEAAEAWRRLADWKKAVAVRQRRRLAVRLLICRLLAKLPHAGLARSFARRAKRLGRRMQQLEKRNEI